jgi:hypothetical protein
MMYFFRWLSGQTAARWLASSARLLARVDQLAGQGKILKSQQEAGGRAV